ncbi:hypothetical protein FHETE_7816 [Fusarium heterosporum]|uniref:WSC domain-containing protein n=1 Tax=Fusarium heterosporum TaxID=42747 RepID=A0A8H5SZ82_FUSHE|nr:hypothetical protein FHETE_7816 [Fusarium heterosporum]
MTRLNILHIALFLWVALTAAQASASTRLTPQGCYEGRPRHARLGGVSRHREDCAKTCVRLGRRIVAFGSINCFCADESAYLKSHRVDNDRCQHCSPAEGPHCAQDRAEVYSVFKIEVNQPNSNERLERVSVQSDETKSPPTRGQITAHGCYQAFSRSMVTRGMIDDSNTRVECAMSCAKEGMPVAIFMVYACFCAKKYPRDSGKVAPNKCFMPCLSDNDDRCQRTGELDSHDSVYASVYNTGLGIRVETDLDFSTYPGPEKTSPDNSESYNHTPLACIRNLPLSLSTYRRYDLNHPSKCQRFCTKMGKGYAYMKEKDCRCSNEFPRKSLELSENQCDILCPESDLLCGGKMAYSIYSVGSKEKPVFKSEPSPGRQVARCFSEVPSNAISMAAGWLDENNYHESCLEACKSVQKPVAFMREYQCICAETYPRRSTSVPDQGCYYPCIGDSFYSCGGYLSGATYSAYRTAFRGGRYRIGEAAEGSKPFTEIFATIALASKTTIQGCYSHQPDYAVLKQFRDRNSAYGCVHYCRQQGKAVAAVRDGWCSCTDTYPSDNFKVDHHKCNIPCTGSNMEICGGLGTWSIWNTGADFDKTSDRLEINKVKVEGNETRHGVYLGDSPAAKQQCSHSGLESIYETSSWIMERMAKFAHGAGEVVSGFLDNAQDVFDACLWNVMVFTTNIMYKLGWMSGEGGVDL